MVHSKYAGTVGDLMKALDADQAGDASGPEDGQYISRFVHIAKCAGIPLKHGMQSIKLL